MSVPDPAVVIVKTVNSDTASMPSFGLADIKRQFSSRTFDRARGIVNSGAVLHLGWDDDDEQWLGVVQGTDSDPYFTSIAIEGGDFETFCSCPVSFDCKHAAACLLEVLEIESAQAFVPEELESQARSSAAESAVDDWANRLILQHRSIERQGQLGSIASDGCMIYSLEPHQNEQGTLRGMALRIFRSHLMKNGKLAKGRLYRIESYSSYHGREATREDDALIDTVRTMVMHAPDHRQRHLVVPYELSGPLGAVVLNKLLESGRTYFDQQRDVPLRSGKALALRVAWESGNDPGLLELNMSVDGLDYWHPVFTDPPWYVDPVANCAGPLISELDYRLLPMLYDAPAVPVESAQNLSNDLSLELPTQWLPLPAPPTVRTLSEPLKPTIFVHSLDDSPDIANWVVACLMCYGDHMLIVDLQRTSGHTRLTDDAGEDWIIQRDRQSEYVLYQRFRYLLPNFEPCHARDTARFSIADNQPVRRDPAGRMDAFEHLFTMIDALEGEGFTVTVRPPVGVAVERIERLSASLTGSEPGWFELGLVLEHAGSRYQLMPLVIDWLERTGGHAPLRFQAEDGSWLEAPEQMLAPVVETLRELLDERQDNDSLRVPRARALTLSHLRDELEESGVESDWEDDGKLFELAANLRNFGRESENSIDNARPPKGLEGELRAYQLQGMAWLNLLSNSGLNGILADDMGLGKTVQALAHLQSLVNSTAKKRKKNRHGPFLVVAPTSLLGNWAREAKRFTPKLAVRIWHGGARHDEPLSDEKADIVVTSYALALRDNELLTQHGFTVLLLDEAQTIKNPNAKITQALKAMPIERRLCLTGTPLENHLGELWSLFDFLMPGMLGSQKRFTQHFRTPIEKHGDQVRQQRLNAVVQPFMLRRRKEQVAKELPEKTEIIQEITLEKSQAQLYESIRLAMQARVKKLLKERGLARSHIEMLDALLKLRQTCCHPQLVKLPAARRVKDSAKTDYALQMIEELVAEGRKILLFSQFTEMLGLLEVALKKRSVDFVKLTGRTRKRDEVIDAFQQGDVPLFLISLKAGGTGLNLTAADTVIHYDPWWNPAVERQATDRAHRIGQDKPVFVYKLVAKDTVEEKIVAMQARKQALADATVEKQDGKTISAFSADDILSLFDAS